MDELRALRNRYRELGQYKAFFSQCATGVLLLILSLIFNYYANKYVELHVGLPAKDLILDSLPVRNMDDIVLEGAIIFLVAVTALGFYWPKKIPFILKSVSLFYTVRSFFIILTHIAPPIGQANPYTGDLMRAFTSGNDLFFSGHTGLPFLMALIFWPNKVLRYAFIILSIIFGFSVLAAHLHYSIDVFSAFFITFGIYHLAKNFFRPDFILLQSSEADSNV